MHPAFSVLFFTVTSGFGYGLLFCLFVAHLLGVQFTQQDLVTIAGIAFILFTLGLLSSTQHLANPKNAWRAFMRVRTSWLSREGVFALLGYPIFALGVYVLMKEYEYANLILLAGIILIIAIVYSTAMIYASLRTIPQWHNRWVVAGFLVFALSSGMLLFAQLCGWQFDYVGERSIYDMEWNASDRVYAALAYPTAVVLILAFGLVIKLMTFRVIGRPTRSSINSATSFSQAHVTLFDSGHSSKNFLQKEFMYEVGPKTTQLARRVALLLAFILPVMLLLAVTFGVMTLSTLAGPLGWVMIGSVYLGLLVERWLFFIEAKHVVRHFYGE